MARSLAAKPVTYLPKKLLTADAQQFNIARLDKRITELKSFDLNKIVKGTSPELAALSAAIRDTLDRCFGEGTQVFRRFESATSLPWFPMYATRDYPQPQDYIHGVREHINRSIALLQESQRTIREDLADAADKSVVNASEIVATLPSNKIFVVHGHDDAAKQRQLYT